MSTNLRIFRAKPNPVGRDGKDQRSTEITRPEVLLGEWVDIENIGTESITFSSIELHHTLFNDLCQTRGETEVYWSAEGRGLLKPAQVLRVHTGKHRDKTLMATVDDSDTDWHAFAKSDDFILNTRCGDIVVVTWLDEEGRTYRDAASYAPHPPAGAVLTRRDNQLQLESKTIRARLVCLRKQRAKPILTSPSQDRYQPKYLLSGYVIRVHQTVYLFPLRPFRVWGK